MSIIRDFTATAVDLVAGALFFVVVGYITIELFEWTFKSFESLNSPWYVWLMLPILIVATSLSEMKALVVGGVAFSGLVLVIALATGEMVAAGMAVLGLVIAIYLRVNSSAPSF